LVPVIRHGLYRDKLSVSLLCVFRRFAKALTTN
jgi:hypothetical protein